MEGEIPQSKTVRDDFSAVTIRRLAARVGYRCSNPGCRRPTSGPAVDEAKAINVGEAAHITAAAPGGKRYDATLMRAQRRDESNGIWLCRFCARLIDTDEKRFPEELLRKWKQDALDDALKALTTAAPGAYERPIALLQLDEADREFLRALALPAEDDDVESVVTRMREAAKRDIAAFRAAKEYPTQAISLALTLHAKGGSHAIPIDGLANGIDVAETLNLVAAPGTGKTITLVQPRRYYSRRAPARRRTGSARRMVRPAGRFLCLFETAQRISSLPRATFYAVSLSRAAGTSARRLERA
jgi:hypothetical protein